MAQAKPMTKSQIIDHLAEKTDVPKKTAKQFVEELVMLSYKEAKKSFTIPGLGKLLVVSRKKRKGRNPATGAIIQIPAKKVLKFRVAKAAKDAILEGKMPVVKDNGKPAKKAAAPKAAAKPAATKKAAAPKKAAAKPAAKAPAKKAAKKP